MRLFGYEIDERCFNRKFLVSIGAAVILTCGGGIATMTPVFINTYWSTHTGILLIVNFIIKMIFTMADGPNHIFESLFLFYTEHSK